MEHELSQLIAASTSLALDLQRSGSDGVTEDDPESSGVRMHVPTKLPSHEALCNKIIRRVLNVVDQDFPCLVACLFGAQKTLCGLHAEERLEFSANEPAINVYFGGGGFSPHKDYCALTMLIPLTSPTDGSFTGGGTGFWAPESRRQPKAEPCITLAPSAGTAMIFAGDVLHAGMPVETGTRVVLVASFDRKLVAE